MSSARETVESMYAAFGAKDEAALRSVLHPDVQWNQCDGMPGGARRRGVESVIDGVLRKLNSTWNDFRVEIERFVSDAESDSEGDGGTVVVLGAYSGTHGTTQKPMRAVFAHVYEVNDRRIVRFDQIADTAVMVAAATN